MGKKTKNRLPKLMILVGLPGSGKSYFSENLASINNNLVIISQDTLGSKSKCEEELIKAVKSKNKNIIIDKCNPKISDRKYWVDYSMINKKEIVIVFFDYSMEDCIERVKNRVGHPTIKFGRGENIVKTFHKQLEIPTEEEGFKKILKIRSFDECNDVLIKLGCDPSKLNEIEHNIIKFPRTHHIFDAGGTGVTRDDLLLSDDEIEEYLNCELTLEEKVDGANLGISIDRDYNIIFQNRSHYVTYTTSTQFKGLKIWQDTYGGDLFSILKPNRHILYGEWCYAKHSIHYTRLPGYFLAFDIFDKFENRFLSRKKFNEVMSKTSIPIVPIVDKTEFKTKTELKDRLMKYLDTKSMFMDGFVEGIYIRKDCTGEMEDWLDKRCKLVRPDFTQGIETHWSKMELTKNTIRYD